MDSNYRKTVVTRVWNRRLQAWETQTIDLHFTIDFMKLAEMLAAKVGSNKSGKTRTLNGIITAKGKII